VADQKSLSDIFEMSKGYRRGMAKVDYLKNRKAKVEALKAKKAAVKEDVVMEDRDPHDADWTTHPSFGHIEKQLNSLHKLTKPGSMLHQHLSRHGSVDALSSLNKLHGHIEHAQEHHDDVGYAHSMNMISQHETSHKKR
jgi:hypothetical protein